MSLYVRFQDAANVYLKKSIVSVRKACCPFWISVRVLKSDDWNEHLGLSHARNLFPKLPSVFPNEIYEAGIIRDQLRKPHIGKTEIRKDRQKKGWSGRGIVRGCPNSRRAVLASPSQSLVHKVVVHSPNTGTPESNLTSK